MGPVEAVDGGMFIDGLWVPPHGTQVIDVVNPATECVIGRIPAGDALDVDRAVGAARAAFRTGWRDRPAGERATALRRLADGVERRAEDLALLVARQNGVPISSCRASVAKASSSYRYFATLAEELSDEEARPSANGHTIVREEPLGVAALIIPWNGPQPLLAWKLGPALAAGCTAVVKPAPETTLDALLLMEAVLEAGIPPGVVNLIPGGRETGAALVAHCGVDKVAFTGSTAAGRLIAESCGRDLKPVTLELGGKSAAIVLDDVELEAFRALVVPVCSPNSGQVCRACTRILVPADRYRDAVAVVVDAMSGAAVGDPMDPTTVMGPLVSSRQRDRVEEYIRIGIDDGATLACGGGRPADLPSGYYVQPTVFTDVRNDMRVAREEIFGPVVVVMPYDDEEDALRIANDSEYGLGGFILTGDVERGMALARRVETGSIGVNNPVMAMEAPFGGYKQSGLGREMGPESVAAYRQKKSIYRPDPAPGRSHV